jgi:hypothetical protein
MRPSYGLTHYLDCQTLKEEVVGSSETWVAVLTPVLMQIQDFWDVFILKMHYVPPKRRCKRDYQTPTQRTCF